MVNKMLLSFLVVNVFFFGTGCLLVAVFFLARAGMAQPTVASVATNLLLMQTPLTGISLSQYSLARKHMVILQTFTDPMCKRSWSRKRRPDLLDFPYLLTRHASTN